MGVSSVYCPLCGLPTALAQYVPAEDAHVPGMLRIHRGLGAPKGGFALDERHAWLAKTVVVVPGRALGEAEDRAVRAAIKEGGIEGFPDVELDDDEAVAYHERCWARVGSPKRVADAPSTRGTHAWAMVEPYQGQLFSFCDLAVDGRAWMLEDPAANHRSAARLAQLAELAQPADHGSSITSIPDLLTRDRNWAGYAVRDKTGGRVSVARVRYQMRSTDRSDYGDAVLLRKVFPPSARIDPAHEALELAVKAAVEERAAAIMTLVRYTTTDTLYLMYARDGAATYARIEAVPGLDEGVEAALGSRPEPDWATHHELTTR